MARVKKITVKDLLNLMEDHELIMIHFYAYGIPYGTSIDSGKTVKEVKENMRSDCLQAQVYEIKHLTSSTGIIASIV